MSSPLSLLVQVYTVADDGAETLVGTGPAVIAECFDLSDPGQVEECLDIVDKLTAGAESVDVGGGAAAHFRIKLSDGGR